MDAKQLFGKSCPGRRLPIMLLEEKACNISSAVAQQYAEEVCFGRVWPRDDIVRKQRRTFNVAKLIASNRPAQSRHHLEGAITSGCEGEEHRGSLQDAACSGSLAAGEAVLDRRIAKVACRSERRRLPDSPISSRGKANACCPCLPENPKCSSGRPRHRNPLQPRR